MRILGIETSCDETAAAVIEAKNDHFLVLSNVVASQTKIHAKTGGVVPEVAARAHAEAIVPVVEEALRRAAKSQGHRAKSKKLYTLHSTLYASSIDAIAVTAGPGLATSLLVGVEVARTLSWLWKKPLVAVNHLAGHVYSNWLPPIGETRNPKPETRNKSKIPNLKFPILCLIVSGGHTELVLMRKHLDYEVIGETRDDAAGEAFDKVAKILGLGYPGGPAIAKLAEQSINPRHLEPRRKVGVRDLSTMQGVEISPLASRLGRNDGLVHFPRPMIDSPDFDFSFSGLKTAVLYYIRDFLKKGKKATIVTNLTQQDLADVCFSFEQAVVDVLVAKTVRAAERYRVKTVMLGGGVAANARLRRELSIAIKRQLPTTSYVLPSLQFTTDNAAMIAVAGYFIACTKQFTLWQRLDIDPNWKLGLVMEP